MLMKSIRNLFAFAFFASLFSSCNNDLKITADWKEVTAIWGLLNANDSVHYFRITKGYLDPNTGASVGAKVEDSLYYPNLQAQLEEYSLSGGNWVFSKSYSLQEDRSIPKDSGFFGSNYQILYKAEAKLDAAKQYKIVAVTPSGDEVSSSTKLVNNFALSEPPRLPGIIKMSRKANNIKFTTPANGKIHEMKARIHYTQYDPDQPTQTNEFKFVDYTIYKNLYINSPGLFTYSLNGLELIEFLNQSLPKIDTINRQLKGIEFIVYMGGEDLATFININQPSTSIVQERPSFTNVSSKKGNPTAGIFSSRVRIPTQLKDNGIDANYYLQSPTFREVSNLDSLAKYPQLKFVW
jgi:hypothetical protein